MTAHGEHQSVESDAVRSYTESEHVSFKAVSRREWNQPYKRGEGPAEYAGGDWWPTELEKRAAEFERLIYHYRNAAAALRREIAADPRTRATPPGEQAPR
jgi:hypothetical protein